MRGAHTRTVKASLAAVFLLFQLLFPWFVAARPGFTWRDFSWDMFSRRLSCARLDFVVHEPDGSTSRVDLGADFGASWSTMSRVLVPGRLAAYADVLCQRLRREHGYDVRLHIHAECREHRHGPNTPVADPARDFCAAAP